MNYKFCMKCEKKFFTKSKRCPNCGSPFSTVSSDKINGEKPNF